MQIEFDKLQFNDRSHNLSTITSRLFSTRKRVKTELTKKESASHGNGSFNSDQIVKSMQKLKAVFDVLRQRQQYVSQRLFRKTLNEQFKIDSLFKPNFIVQNCRSQRKVIAGQYQSQSQPIHKTGAKIDVRQRLLHYNSSIKREPQGKFMDRMRIKRYKKSEIELNLVGKKMF